MMPFSTQPASQPARPLHNENQRKSSCAGGDKAETKRKPEIMERSEQGANERVSWFQLMDTRAFSRPESFPQMPVRLRQNLCNFGTKYAILFLALILLSYPLSLVALSLFSAAWGLLYLFSCPAWEAFNRIVSEGLNEDFILLSGLALVTFAVLCFTRYVSYIPLLIGMLLVLVHGTFRGTDYLFPDNEEMGHGLLSGYLSS
jgi:hypothetical protein